MNDNLKSNSYKQLNGTVLGTTGPVHRPILAEITRTLLKLCPMLPERCPNFIRILSAALSVQSIGKQHCAYDLYYVFLP